MPHGPAHRLCLLCHWLEGRRRPTSHWLEPYCDDHLAAKEGSLPPALKDYDDFRTGGRTAFLHQALANQQIDAFGWFDTPRYIAISLSSKQTLLLFAGPRGLPAFTLLGDRTGSSTLTTDQFYVSPHAACRIRPDLSSLRTALSERPTIAAVLETECELTDAPEASECLRVELNNTALLIQSDVSMGSIYDSLAEDIESAHGWPTVVEDLWLAVIADL